MIVGLYPELLAPGGTQRAGRHTAAVLAEYAERQGTPYRFLSLSDPPGTHQLRVGEHVFTARGFARAKQHFILAALRLALRHPRLVVAGHPNLAPVAWAIQSLFPGPRTVVLTHGIEVWTPLPVRRRWPLRRADLVLAPSADTAGKLVSVQGVPKEKVRQLPWGLDPDFPAGCASMTNHVPPGFPKGRVVLTVARLAANERYKGVDNLIKAVPRLLPSVPDLHLVAVGDGDDRPQLEKLAREIGAAERVHFLSGLAQEELVACYGGCDVFALPSGGEGFGFVFLEAMGLGKPVVGGAHGGIPDIIEDGVTGFLVPFGDGERLAGVLQRLLSDEPLRREMGQRARERLRSMYLFEHFRTRLARIIEDVCAS